MANNPIYIWSPIKKLFGDDYERLFCNSYYFFTVDGHKPPPCCTLEVCSLYSKTLKEVLADGVVDQTDFDRYDHCDIIDSEQVRTAFSKKLYASLRRFSSLDFFKSFLSDDESIKFRNWFEKGGYDYLTSSRSADNTDILGEALLCKDKTHCRVPIYSEKMMLVVHPTNWYDDSDAFFEINSEISAAKETETPIIYLVQPDGSFDMNYVDDLSPTYWVASKDGENKIEFWGSEVIATGGYVNHCFAIALADLVSHYKGEELTIRVPTEAVYTVGHGAWRSYLNWLGSSARNFEVVDFCNSFKNGKDESLPFFSARFYGKTGISCESVVEGPKITIVIE